MRKMPSVGLGTWELRGKTCTDVVKLALELGYRHIDTAQIYENHEAIGKALAHVPREELYVTSKFSPGSKMDLTHVLKELKCDYLDLLLLHWPEKKSFKSDLKELFVQKESGKVKEVGVSNFTIRQLEEMLKLGFVPYCNQVEFHPYLYQNELLEFCNNKGILLVSYRTLGKGKLLEEKQFKEIAEKHLKSVAQILLRWCLEKGIPVIPKASSKKHLQENLELFDFKLDREDLAILDHVGIRRRFCGSDADFED